MKSQQCSRLTIRKTTCLDYALNENSDCGAHSQLPDAVVRPSVPLIDNPEILELITTDRADDDIDGAEQRVVTVHGETAWFNDIVRYRVNDQDLIYLYRSAALDNNLTVRPQIEGSRHHPYHVSLINDAGEFVAAINNVDTDYFTTQKDAIVAANRILDRLDKEQTSLPEVESGLSHPRFVVDILVNLHDTVI